MKTIIIYFVTFLCGFANAQTWTQKEDFPGTAREAGVLCLLNNKLFAGLGGTNIFYNDWYEYNITDNIWVQKENFPGVPRFAPAYFELNGKIYVGCGFASGFVPLKDFYCFNPANNSWIQVADLGGAARGGTIHFSINGKGYCGTGADASFNALQDMWQYNDINNTWTQLNNFSAPRWRMAAFILGNYVYAGCGRDNSSAKNDFWKYNPSGDSWTQIADFSGFARVSPFAIVSNGFGYAGTGSSFTGSNYQDVYKYDPSTNSWTQQSDFPGGQRNSTAYASDGNKSYVCFGNSISGWKKDLWEFSGIIGIHVIPGLVPSIYSLEQNYPNPFNPSTIIKFTIPIPGFTTLKVYDALGSEVQTLINETLSAGGYEIAFDGSNFSSGIYYYRIEVNNTSASSGREFTETKKMVLTK